MKKIENTFGWLLAMWFRSLWSFSLDGRLSRGQLRIADMMLRLWVTIFLLIDLAIFKIPVLVFIFLLAAIIKTILLMVKRMNDLDLDPKRLLAALGLIIFCLIIQTFWTYIVLILFVIAFQIFLYAVPGTEWSNEYWPDPLKIQPKTNEKYYILVGILIFLILTIWAIVAFFLGWLEMLWFWWGN